MESKPKNLLSKIKHLPNAPGVYEFLDSKGNIIYVGKARQLRKRVASYFQAGRPRDNRLELLVREISDIKFIKTSSEAEAFIYEAGLIKDFTPKFNVELKDDKSYPFLKLTVNEKYPRLFLTRKKRNDNALYYGPYVNVRLLRQALSFMKRVFPLRSCRRLAKGICLEYHLGQCVAPCEDKITGKEYRDIVSQLRKFLEGKKDDLILSLREDMSRFSKNQEYEKALSIKKRIEALTAVQMLHDRSQQPIYGELDELENILHLKSSLKVIECFDISNISGKQAVGSMVRFVSGLAAKDGYRRFRIKKTINRIDDYSMIQEIVARRYSRLLREGKAMPDLVLIDGGKGHLKTAKKTLEGLGLKVPVASIAKEHNYLYTESRRLPIRLSPGSRLLFLIQRIRDEAHRFAINYHRRLREKESFSLSQ